MVAAVAVKIQHPAGHRQVNGEVLCRVLLMPSQWHRVKVFPSPPRASWLASQWGWLGDGDAWDTLQAISQPQSVMVSDRGTTLSQRDGLLWELYSVTAYRWQALIHAPGGC